MTISTAHLFACSKWIASAASLFLAVIPSHGLSAAEPDQKLLALRVISSLDQRVATLAYKLAITGVNLCPISTPLSGFSVHHLSQYSVQFKDAARAHFALDDRVRVLSVAADGPADRAGLKAGDVIKHINGKPLPELTVEVSEGSAAFVDHIEDILDRKFADGAVHLLIIRGDEHVLVRIEPDLGCRSKVNLKPSNDLNAYADGSKVIITTAISGLAHDNAELAAVLAHELAHNILRHRTLLDKEGRNRRLIRFTEFEADKLSIHLLHTAGFDPNAALRFWSRYGPRQGGPLTSSGHPNWRSRVKLMAIEIETLDFDQKSD